MDRATPAPESTGLVGPRLFLEQATAKVQRLSAPLVRRLLRGFHAEPMPERWIFVVGCYNSGTSLLARILASHPEVGGLPDEGIYYTGELPYPEQFGWPRMWIRCLDDVRLDPDRVSRERVSRIKREWAVFFPGDTPNLLEKSVSNSARVEFLARHFRPASFVEIVRNGYAVAEGIRRRAHPGEWGNPEYGDRYPIELCAEQWAKTDEVLEAAAGEVGRFHTVRYEDLAEDPDGTMGGVTDFLGIPGFDRGLGERVWYINDRAAKIRNMNPASLERLSDDDVSRIERTAGRRLDRYGYRPG